MQIASLGCCCFHCCHPERLPKAWMKVDTHLAKAGTERSGSVSLSGSSRAGWPAVWRIQVAAWHGAQIQWPQSTTSDLLWCWPPSGSTTRLRRQRVERNKRGGRRDETKGEPLRRRASKKRMRAMTHKLWSAGRATVVVMFVLLFSSHNCYRHWLLLLMTQLSHTRQV